MTIKKSLNLPNISIKESYSFKLCVKQSKLDVDVFLCVLWTLVFIIFATTDHTDYSEM